MLNTRNLAGQFLRGASLMLLAAASQASQAGQAAPDSAVGTKEVPHGSDDILVTANRRSQSIRDVPYNISALSAAQLQDRRITDMSALVQATPGVVLVDRGVRGNSSNNGLIIRGINATGTGLGSDIDALYADTVSTYLGETPVFFNMAVRDMERVEVLRGPQGTLYGSGSLGGTIRFIPVMPQLGKIQARASLELGNTRTTSDINQNAEAMLNLPLGDKAALRVSGGYEKVQGIVDSPNEFVLVNGRPVDAGPVPFGDAQTIRRNEADDAEVYSVRAALRLQPIDTATVDLYYQHQTERAHGQTAVTRRGDVPFGPMERGNFLAEPLERKVDLFGGDIALDLGAVALSSTTSYYENVGNLVSDFSGFYATNIQVRPPGLDRVFVSAYIQSSRTGFTQEVRLSSQDNDATISYVAGAYYSLQTNRFTETDVGPEVPDQQLGPDSGVSDVLFIISRRFRFSDLAGFGELTVRINDRLAATAGIRVFRQQFETTQTTSFPNLRETAIFIGEPLPEDEVSIAIPKTTSNTTRAIFKANVSYDFSDAAKAYFTFSQGFRRGGANGIPTIGPFAEDPELLNYGPDEVNNFEIGLKGRMGSVSYSLAGFLINWDNIQIFTLAPNGSGDVVVNGGAARSQGIELELDWSPTKELNLSLGYSLTDAKLTTAFETATIIGLKGARLPGVSRHQISSNLSYTAPVSQSADVVAQLSAFYRSNFVTDISPNLPSYDTLPGYVLVDGSIGVRRGPWSARMFVENVLDRRAVTAFAAPETVGSFHTIDWFTRPRTIGLGLSYNFN